MTKLTTTQGFRTWIEVYKENLAHNISVFKDRIGDAKMMAIVKSNAYGHGFVQLSTELQKLKKVDWLGVDSVVEGLRLRKEGIKLPILVLGYTLPERVEEAVQNNISLTASTFEFLEACEKLELIRKIKIHLKVDTGLHRQGFLDADRDTALRYFIKKSSAFELEGMYTHFAQAKNPVAREYTKGQLELFYGWVGAAKEAGLKPLVHAAATAGTLLYPEAHFDMVRVGAGVYGLWPSAEVKAHEEKNLSLKPLLSWRTIISERKSLPKSAPIGYDLTETLSRNSTIAICPIGYWHGYARNLSSVGEVLVNGVRAKVLGRVAMDMIIIDITDIPEAKVGTIVTLIGKDGNDEITAEELALKAHMSPYEFLTRLNPLIKKIY